MIAAIVEFYMLVAPKAGYRLVEGTMSVMGLLNRVFPESRLKYRLKRTVEHSLFRVTGPARTCVLKDGITVRYYPALLVPRAFDDIPLIGYERHYTIKPGDVVVDGGGFQGLFTLFAAKKVGPTGKVVTYEPDPQIARLLERNIKLNRLENVTLVQKGLWSHTTELYFDTRGVGGNVDFAAERNNLLVEKIGVVALDDEVERLQLSRIDLIKMNIEGAEIEAIEGCRRLMQRFRVNFSVAANHYRDGEQTARRVQQLLIQGGYEAITDYPTHLSVYAWPRQ